jgi:hypothetical protein
MNKDLDKKLQLYIGKMAIWELPFGNSEWDSSAKKLEDALREHGIGMKLYYEYKMPGGLSQSDFMNRLCLLEFFIKFYPRYAIKVLSDKKLTKTDKAKIFQYVWHNRRKFIKTAKQYEAEIRRLNPELASIKTNHPNSYSIIYGATFGFAPDEIAYFADVSNRDFKWESRIIDLFKKKYGIEVTYVLAPKTAEKVINLLEQNIQINSKDR